MLRRPSFLATGSIAVIVTKEHSGLDHKLLASRSIFQGCYLGQVGSRGATAKQGPNLTSGYGGRGYVHRHR